MITISLDEFGDFEGLTAKKEPIYIGGLLFDDHGEEGEEENERLRIRAYYEAVILDAKLAAKRCDGFEYPMALHSNNDGDKKRNWRVVGSVKERIRQTIAEFIQKGTYKERPLVYKGSKCPVRKGEYYLFAILKSDRGMTDLLSKKAGILARDDYASNLYFHMADTVVSRLIFYNPVLPDIKDLALDIATRSSGDIQIGSEMYKEYKSQGYIGSKEEYQKKETQVSKGNQGYRGFQNNKPKEDYFRLTNADVYRTVIAEEILDAERPDINISRFNVNSIQYKSGAKGMEFLYMADSICSVLGFGIGGNNADDWLKIMVERAGEITGRTDDLIFGYDEIDNYYAKAWKKYKEGDYYKALGIAFDAMKQKGAFAEFYGKQWFQKLEDRIAEEASVSDFTMAVRKLNETRFNNTLDQDKFCYILNVMERAANQIRSKFNTAEATRILYTFYDAGITAYCHIGDSKKAEEYFKKCQEYAGLVGVEDYLSTLNKTVVFCCDYFNLDQAEMIGNKNIEYQERLMEFKNELAIPGMKDAGAEALGKAYSQRGQVYAFRQDARAEQDFKKALSCFVKESANYKITQSYLLHHYLDMNNQTAYMLEAQDYYGGNDGLAEQLEYLLTEGRKKDSLINVKFAFYPYLKALYQFRLEELSDDVWKKIQKTEEILRNHDEKLAFTGHPSELIFKYLQLIGITRGDGEKESVYKDRMRACLQYQGVTETVICDFAEVEILNAKKVPAQRDLYSAKLCKKLKEEFASFADADIPVKGDDRYRWLEDHITFMYR